MDRPHKLAGWLKVSLPGWVAILFALLALHAPAGGHAAAQQPTGSVATVTGTASGPIVTVYGDLSQIDVYAGPSTYLYPAVGVLLAGQSVPALGRATTDETWIQVFYPGVPGSKAWVYAPYVRISPGARLQPVEAPPTPTPSVPTIEPTLAAAFVAPVTPTRLSTFTPPPEFIIPTFVEDAGDRTNQIPAGLLIFSLGFLGALGVLISFLRGR